MVITVKDKSDTSKEWTPDEEIQLFCAMENLKPVGINKHFYMALILDRLNNSRSSSEVWAHLGKLYDLKALDAEEPTPFASEDFEPFSLPQPEFVLVKREPEIKVEPKAEPVVATTKSGKPQSTHHKEVVDKKAVKQEQPEPKRATKRTRGSTTSLESPASTPPPTSLSHKRRRI